MTFNILVTFLAVLSMWNIADANTGESLEMRIYDRDAKPLTDREMWMKLEEAALEKHGFKLEITSKLVKESESDQPTYQKVYFYYKFVDCSQVPEVSDELEYLIPGVFKSNSIARIRSEVRNRNLDHLKKCQTGLEVHFRGSGGCKTKQDRTRRSPCFLCWGCFHTKAVV